MLRNPSDETQYKGRVKRTSKTRTQKEINWTQFEEMEKKETNEHCRNENKEEMEDIDGRKERNIKE